MHKILKLTASLLILTIFFTSCEGDNVNDVSKEVFQITKVKNSQIVNDVKKAFNANLKLTNKNSEFDFDNVEQIRNTETGTVSYMINSIYNENIKIGAYPDLEGDYKLLKIEQEVEGEIQKITYKDLNNIVITELLFNPIDKTVSVNPSINTKNRGCGQDVADCVNVNYNQNGWWGVAGYVITLYQPWFGAAVVAGCALYVC